MHLPVFLHNLILLDVILHSHTYVSLVIGLISSCLYDITVYYLVPRNGLATISLNLFSVNIIIMGRLISLILTISSCLSLFRLCFSSETNYILVGVSGGLQDGFPNRSNLDYNSGLKDESKAIFVGKVLVRGYKAYLDLMQDGWRQYSPEPSQPLMNSNVFASGCYEHANEYWIYIVDSRVVWGVLAQEPRFLSITPDKGLLDLTAFETDDAVCKLFRHEIVQHLGDKSNMDQVAVPLVTAVWYNSQSHIPSPPIHIKEDGTRVTNFPESLALWAGINDADRTAMIDYYARNPKARACKHGDSCHDALMEDPHFRQAQESVQRYWDGLRHSIRQAEKDRSSIMSTSNDPHKYKCEKYARFGVDNETLRVNYPFTQSEIQQSFSSIGYAIDFEEGELSTANENMLENEL